MSGQVKLDWLDDAIYELKKFAKLNAPKDVVIDGETRPYVNLPPISLEGFSSLYDDIESVLAAVPTRPPPPVPQGTVITHHLVVDIYYCLCSRYFGFFLLFLMQSLRFSVHFVVAGCNRLSVVC
jgi:hypothetical protein